MSFVPDVSQKIEKACGEVFVSIYGVRGADGTYHLEELGWECPSKIRPTLNTYYGPGLGGSSWFAQIFVEGNLLHVQ